MMYVVGEQRAFYRVLCCPSRGSGELRAKSMFAHTPGVGAIPIRVKPMRIVDSCSDCCRLGVTRSKEMNPRSPAESISLDASETELSDAKNILTVDELA